MQNNRIIAIVLLLLAVILVIAYFSNAPSTPSVQVVAPARGDVLTVGSRYTVEWKTRNIPATDKISITIRRIPPPPLPEEGQEFDPIVFTDLPNTGSHDWTVSDMYPPGTYVLGVTSYASVPIIESVSGESAPFQIEAGVIGGQKDEHGCLIAAGYSWCEARSSCIRLWETYCTAAAGKTVTFTCNDSKSITATFYLTDDKFVDLTLSDGRKMSVPHALSASGARYAKDDGSFVFWNKGDTAFVTEGETGAETYSNCKLQ